MNEIKSIDYKDWYINQGRMPDRDSAEYNEACTVGQSVTVDIFTVGEHVDVSGTTKGRGFSGVIKKEGFSGGRTTHGSKCHRIPGSIGSSAWPSRVTKGKGMPGHYGFERQTMQNI